MIPISDDWYHGMVDPGYQSHSPIRIPGSGLGHPASSPRIGWFGGGGADLVGGGSLSAHRPCQAQRPWPSPRTTPLGVAPGHWRTRPRPHLPRRRPPPPRPRQPPPPPPAHRFRLAAGGPPGASRGECLLPVEECLTPPPNFLTSCPLTSGGHWIWGYGDGDLNLPLPR